MMRLVEREHQIVILKPATSKNNLGETITGDFEEYDTPWAAYLPISDGERLRAAAVEQKTDARFQVLWSEKLNAVNGAFRLRFDGSDWQITGVKPVGRRLGLEITAWRRITGDLSDVG